MANWYVKRGSQIAGPLTLERLKELASQGKVQETDLVREGEDGSFKTADQIPGLIPPDKSDNWDDFEADTHSQPTSTPPKKSNTTLIVVLSILVGGGILVVLAMIALILPAIQQAREAARRSVSKNNLKQMGLALHNYHETHSIFPPGGIETTDGKPYHSFQTMLLPFMDSATLYNRINYSTPWSDPENQPLFQVEIPHFLNPAIAEKVSPEGFGLSHYVGNELFLKKNQGIRIRGTRDGLANTIMAVETGENFKPWGDPTNIAEPVNIMGAGKTSSFSGGNHVLLGDGSVRFISENIDPQLLKALSTPDGGERVGEF